MAISSPRVALLTVLLVSIGCGDSSDNVVSDDGGPADDGGVDFADADPNAPDAGPNAGCDPAGVECNNCIDDDGDTLIDGFDPECTGSIDDDESSFATGISGDNVDAKKQDCFFDGNSGGGDDKCSYHTCCLLTGECPDDLQPPVFDPARDCEISQQCIDNCAPLTPPGCDCFGCCTICNGDTCADVLTNPAVAPDCTAASIEDPALCPPCNKAEECDTPCNPLECILCPGQTQDDLPPECDVPACPSGLTPCADNTDCLADEFCSAGCCIRAID